MKALIIILPTLLGCYLIVFVAYIQIKNKTKASVTASSKSHSNSYAIMKEIRINNSYNEMLTVLVDLEKDLRELNAELHVNLRGYLEYDQTK